MNESIKVLDYNVQIVKAGKFRKKIEAFWGEGRVQSILFLSVPILEQVMISPEYAERIGKFDLLFPGEEKVLTMYPVEEYREKHFLMNEAYLEEILHFIERHGYTMYVVGDRYEKVQGFLSYCKCEFHKLQIVGSFVGGEQMDDDSLLNDINVTCPDIILTSIEPQLQENWIIKNLDKLNGHICIGADVIIQGMLDRYLQQVQRESHSKIYNRYVDWKTKMLEGFQMRTFRSNYEQYMKQKGQG